jgi:hypothetical protein
MLSELEPLILLIPIAIEALVEEILLSGYSRAMDILRVTGKS